MENKTLQRKKPKSTNGRFIPRPHRASDALQFDETTGYIIHGHKKTAT